MISERYFLVLSDDRNGLPSSTVHLFNHVARHNRVFWLNVINRVPRPTRKDLKKVIGVLRNWSGRSEGAKQQCNGCKVTSSGVVHSSTPFMIPWFKPGIRRLNCISLLRKF